MHRFAVLVSCSIILAACSSNQEATPRDSAAEPTHVDPFSDNTSDSESTAGDVAPVQTATPSPPSVIMDIGQLPLRTYPVGSSATEFMSTDEQFEAMAEQLRIDIELDINENDIRDVNGLKQLHSTLMNIALFQENYLEAREQIESIRDLETNEARAITTGLMMGAIIDAWQHGGRDNPASDSLYERYLRQRLAQMPWEIVEVDIVGRQRNSSQMNPEIFQAIITTGLDPMFEQDGSVDSMVARQLVTLKSIIDLQMPLMDQTNSVYQEAIDAHAGD